MSFWRLLQANQPLDRNTMASSCTAIFAFTLLLELSTYSSMALPRGAIDQLGTDQGVLASSAEDDANEVGPGLLSFRRYPVIEGRLAGEDGTKRIFILADTGIKGSPGRENNIPFPKNYPVLPLRGTTHTLDGFSTRDERRSADDVTPLGRRDADILRCMIGRVYRPCWQA